ncbi:choice-of-anchor B family protein [candidate division KSB1 bacterium]|nr:choice-of-anchor B family protein [candidate division KSB1 bacterium]NIX69889.1 choice-of-anchor B family protein [candidate division KSB1 bacterium]
MHLKFTVIQALMMVFAMALSSPVAYGQGSPNVTLLDQLDQYGGYNDCWGYTAPDSREYALLGVVNGTSIVDITDSGNAVEIEFISSPSSTWKDIKTFQDFAYVVNESSGGMQIIDLSDLPNSATLITTYTGFQTSHNIYIDEPNAMLYAEGSGSQPIRAISLADPVDPIQVSSFGISSHDVYARDNVVYVSEGSNGTIGIFDLSTPTSPVLLSRFSIPNAGFVHNAWLSDDGNFLMTTEETTNKTVKLFDIQDLGNEFITDEYLGPSNLAHNTHIKGDFAYISHYADGLRIVDITNPDNIFEAGYYDTSSLTGGFNGAWGAFPFFPSGKVLISDIQNGLFVFSFDSNLPNDMSLDLAPNDPPIVIPSSGGSFTFNVSFTNNTNSTQFFDVWNTIIIPGGEKVPPTIGPVNLDIPAGGTGGKSNINQNVPGEAQAGTYTYIFNIGDFPNRTVATDSFTFSKSTGPTAKVAVGFEISNWDAIWDAGGIQSISSGTLPEEFVLEQNYPNPFNPSTTIAYQLPKAEKVSIIIYDLLGQQVKQLVNENQEPGHYSVQWDGRDQTGHTVATGLYIYQIKAGQFNQTRKMLFVK